MKTIQDLEKQIDDLTHKLRLFRTAANNGWTVGRDPSCCFQTFIVCRAESWPGCVIGTGDTEEGALQNALERISCEYTLGGGAFRHD